MPKPKILIQLDPDAHASVFDAVVAVDVGIDHLLQYHSVEPTQVRDLVHGAIFTRSPKHLANTAIFIGGNDVGCAEEIFHQVTANFIGPMKVSTMIDCNGANSTASAAVIAIERHMPLADAVITVLAGTGPVGRCVSRLLAREGATVRVGSRSKSRAKEVCDSIASLYPEGRLEPVATATHENVAESLQGANVVVAAGAAGVNLLRKEEFDSASDLKVAIDLNAVPPTGIADIESHDRAVQREAVLCYGALGVGGDKMKIHRAALSRLFESNDCVLNAEAIFDIGRSTLQAE